MLSQRLQSGVFGSFITKWRPCLNPDPPPAISVGQFLRVWTELKLVPKVIEQLSNRLEPSVSFEALSLSINSAKSLACAVSRASETLRRSPAE